MPAWGTSMPSTSRVIAMANIPSVRVSTLALESPEAWIFPEVVPSSMK